MGEEVAADERSKEDRGSTWSGIRMYHYMSSILHYI